MESDLQNKVFSSEKDDVLFRSLCSKGKCLDDCGVAFAKNFRP